MHSYDIAKMDSYIDENAEIIFKNSNSQYKDCRGNVIRAFDDKKFMIPEDASYGYGNDKYENGCQDISVRLMGALNDKDIGECVIDMTVRRKGIFGYRVIRIKSDADILGYIFFGREQ